MGRRAIVNIKFKSVKTAETLYKSLLPETRSTIDPKSTVEIMLKPSGEVFLSVKTDSTSTLRALINAYLLWIYSVVEVVKEV